MGMSGSLILINTGFICLADKRSPIYLLSEEITVDGENIGI
jgi:hypothetical protein